MKQRRGTSVYYMERPQWQQRRKAPARSNVKRVMHEYKEGDLKSGSGGKVKSRKQAVAIALSEARKSGAKVPKKKSSK
jgi:hypothetical protein